MPRNFSSGRGNVWNIRLRSDLLIARSAYNFGVTADIEDIYAPNIIWFCQSDPR